MTILHARALTRAAFAPFGEVVETEGAQHFPINAGSCERFHDLARIEIDPAGRPLLSVVRASPVDLPAPLRLMERHPLGSQAFIPLGAHRFLVVVAPGDAPPGPDALQAFLATGGQGVNYRRGVWHHPLLALDAPTDFLVVDRGGPGANLEEHPLPPGWVVAQPEG